MVLTGVRAVGGGVGAAAGDGFGVAAFGACGVLASVGRVTMMKSTVGAGGVLLGALGMGASELIGIEALPVAVNLRRILDLEPL